MKELETANTKIDDLKTMLGGDVVDENDTSSPEKRLIIKQKKKI